MTTAINMLRSLASSSSRPLLRSVPKPRVPFVRHPQCRHYTEDASANPQSTAEAVNNGASEVCQQRLILRLELMEAGEGRLAVG